MGSAVSRRFFSSKDGKVADQIVGFVPKDTIAKSIDKTLTKVIA